MKYSHSRNNRFSKLSVALIGVAVVVIVAFIGAIGARFWYENQLEPVSASSNIVVVEIAKGASVQEIADSLVQQNVIRSSQAFQWYVRNNSLVESMKAGTYELDSAKTTPEIVSIITEGNVKQELFTILPGQRLGQIKEALIKFGYSESEVNNAFNPANYKNHPALVAKPSDASLEGYIYPESFKTDSSTTVTDIITRSLDEMAEVITPELIEAWQKQGLGIHQAVSLASIVENEVSEPSDRNMVAGVFKNRLDLDMALESDPTYLYAGYINGTDGNRSTESPYNTYLYPGIPPGPISNVSKSSLEAVAYPKDHDFLFFVAGDDGITRFSKTLAEHEEKAAKYCIELCRSY